MTSGMRMKGITQERPKSSRHAQPLETTAPPQTRMYMVLWVVEHRPLCSEPINSLEGTRILAVSPRSQVTQIIYDRTARHRSYRLPRLPTHHQILPHLCISTHYLDQVLVWTERAPRSGLVPPRSRATSSKVTHLSLTIPTSRRLSPRPTAPTHARHRQRHPPLKASSAVISHPHILRLIQRSHTRLVPLLRGAARTPSTTSQHSRAGRLLRNASKPSRVAARPIWW